MASKLAVSPAGGACAEERGGGVQDPNKQLKSVPVTVQRHHLCHRAKVWTRAGYPWVSNHAPTPGLVITHSISSYPSNSIRIHHKFPHGPWTQEKEKSIVFWKHLYIMVSNTAVASPPNPQVETDDNEGASAHRALRQMRDLPVNCTPFSDRGFVKCDRKMFGSHCNVWFPLLCFQAVSKCLVSNALFSSGFPPSLLKRTTFPSGGLRALNGEGGQSL